VLRDLARRALELSAEAGRHHTDILAIVRAWHPNCSSAGRLADRRRHAAVRLVTPRTDPFRRSLRHGRRRSPDPGELRPGDNALPPQPPRRPPVNRAFHTIVMSRIRWDQDTQAYVKRRTAEGKTPREIRRGLKRYVARELFRLLEHGPSMA